MRVCAAGLLIAAIAWAQDRSADSMTEKQAREAAASMRVRGQVGSSFDLRVTGTDRSYNYKLRATWITPSVARAAARLLMVTKGFSAQQSQEVTQAAKQAEGWLVLVELDPREGSGVIPKDWVARFGVKGNETRQVTGQPIAPEGVWRSMMAAFPRDYSYDMFLVKFPAKLDDGAPLLMANDTEAELVVRIYNKQGHVRWKIPPGGLQ